MEFSVPFSESYSEARSKFIAIASLKGALLESVVHPTEKGINGEDLAIDFAVFGDTRASKTFFVVSGTHGQEAFLGSAVQIEFLRTLEIPSDVNIVALHILNPWGCSYFSRTDELNTDVNRNFIDHSVKLPTHRLYPKLFNALFPDDWNEDTQDWSGLRDEMIQAHSLQEIVTVLAGGQNAEPTGMNYIGEGPCWSRQVVEEKLPALFSNSKKIAFLEWHTGLGAFGELSHLCSHDPHSASYERIFGWLGDQAKASFSAASDKWGGRTPSYQGLFSAWLPKTAPDAEWAGMLVEVGTYDNYTVLDAVRIDRWLRFGRGTTSVPRDAMRTTMMQALNPNDSSWRTKAMVNSLDAMKRVYEGLRQWQ